jgi:HPt (histidine-containing phosphotransfer) domain-containing protein
MATGDTQQAQMAEALSRLWRQYLPAMEERVAILENAARTLRARELTDDERTAANHAAHKLAGVLGTFGLNKGTVLAREAEIQYSHDADAHPGDAEQLAEIAAELKAMIAERE